MNWCIIPNTQDSYRVNEFGQIQSCRRCGNTKTRKGSWRDIKCSSSGKCPYLKFIVNLDNTHKTKYVHQAVWEAFVGEVSKGLVLDHIDGDRLNNCLDNLRIATYSQNAQHAVKRVRDGQAVSRHRGVIWLKNSQKWKSSIVVNKKVKHLGTFENEQDAAEAYNKAALEFFKDFAAVNII